jgi:DNA primase
VRENYKQLFKNKLWEAYGHKGYGKSRKDGAIKSGPGSTNRVSPVPLTLPRKTEGWEEVLILTVLHHPELLDRVEEEFAAIEFSRPELDKLRQAILEEAFRNPGLDGTGLTHHLSANKFGDLISALRRPLDWVGPRDRKFYSFARLEAAPDEALAGWQHVLARHQGKAALQAELRLAEARLAEQTTEENFRRVQALKEHLAARRGDEAFLDELGTDKRRGSVVG